MKKPRTPDFSWIDEISPGIARATGNLLREILNELDLGEKPPWAIADHVSVYGDMRPDPMHRRQMMHDRQRLGGMLVRRGILAMFGHHPVGRVFLADGDETIIRAAHARFHDRATGVQPSGRSARPSGVGVQWVALQTEAVKGAGGEAGKLLMRGLAGVAGLFLTWLLGEVLGWWSSIATWFR